MYMYGLVISLVNSFLFFYYTSTNYIQTRKEEKKTLSRVHHKMESDSTASLPEGSIYIG